jgi:hypothetical protein
MPKVTNAFTTYLAQANREDLSNAIYNIDPFDTPVMSASRRRNVKNRFFDWQTEFLPTAGSIPAQIEGFVLSANAATPTTRQQNCAQINERDATVSGSQEESDAAGKASEMAHQMALISKVIKSDIELALCSRQGRNDGADNTTARNTESFPHRLGRALDRKGTGANGVTGSGDVAATQQRGGCVTGVIGAAGTITGTPPNLSATGSGLPQDAYDSVVPPGMAVPATPVQITEQMLGDSMQKAYVNGGSPSLFVLPPGPKRTASTFTGRSTTQVLVGKTEVVSTVDVFATDFGRVKCIPSRWVPPDIGLLIDPDYLAVAFFRSFRQFLMARTGDAEQRMIVCEWGVETRNPLAHGLLNGIKQ